MWLIIGYGNSLRGDDGAGPYFVEQLRRRVPNSAAQFICNHQLLPEMIEDLIQPHIDKVLFIDAKRHQSKPYLMTPVTQNISETRSITHRHGPEWLLAMAENLYGESRLGWLLTLSGTDFEHGTQLSTSAQQAIDIALPEIEMLISGRFVYISS
jgi:hydrogenase maturation protease